jgi:citrate lyase subunit beta/citryl-CoA lyase
MSTARQAFSSLRSILEVPLADDRFWPRVAELPADGIMLDLEDSAPPDRKEAARERIRSICRQPQLLGGKATFVRVNGLGSSWGAADLATVSATPPEVIVCYPKIGHEDELAQAQALLCTDGPPRRFYVMVESHAGLTRIEQILSRPEVVGVHFGYTDYAMDVGCALFNADGDDFHGLAMQGPRARIGAAAAGHGVFSTGGTLIPDHRNEAKVAASSELGARTAIPPASRSLRATSRSSTGIFVPIRPSSRRRHKRLSTRPLTAGASRSSTSAWRNWC